MAEKEYIDLETAYDMDTLEDWYINSVSDNDTPVWTEEHLEELLNDFYVIPKDTSKADIAPVHHGHWITQEGWTPDDYYYTCSICNEDFYIIVGTPSDNNYKFCPNCGARMDKTE